MPAASCSTGYTGTHPWRCCMNLIRYACTARFTPLPAAYHTGVGPDARDLLKFVTVGLTPRASARPQDSRPRPPYPTFFARDSCASALLGQVRLHVARVRSCTVMHRAGPAV